MTPILKHLLIWIVTIGVLLLIYPWVQHIWVNHNPQLVNGNVVSGTNKVGWATRLYHFFPIVVLLLYIPLRLYQIRKPKPTQNGQTTK